MLTAEERLGASNPASSVAITRDPLIHPIHFLQRDDALELRLSNRFREAFGVDLIVHRNAGSEVPLYCGERPLPLAGQDRISLPYVEAMERLPQLQTQGDGMRAFAGILLHTSVGPESVVLVDEPEAFLHPPQARLLGRMLVRDRRPSRQLFVATHSGDVLRGLLDAGSKKLRVVRLQRSKEATAARELLPTDIEAVWNDPLLRYSNILDGIFHEKVVVCESDADDRFYAAVLDAVYDLRAATTRRPDVMFTHCGGKMRLPMAVRALKSLSVPLAVVADFDVLRDERPLRSIVEALGLPWASVVGDWSVVKKAIDTKKPDLTTSEVSADIQALLASVTETPFPEAAKTKIKEILRRSSPWGTAKQVGKAFIPSGDASKAGERLFALLQSAGLFIVEVGELEGFAKTVPGHGPAWVNEVLKKDLKIDPELAAARKFAEEIGATTQGAVV